MQPFCSVFILQVVFLWIFPCHWTSTSTFSVFPVDICPKNETEVEEASEKLNCSIGFHETKNEYHCVPMSNFTQLVEFCYPKTSGLIGKGLCMVLSGNILDARECHQFNDGCPDILYTSETMYQFPVCSLINKESKCYLADPACPSLWQPSSTPRHKTITNKNTPMDTGTATMIIVIGIFTPLSLLVLSAFAYFMFRRRRMRNENGGIEEMENLYKEEGESRDTFEDCAIDDDFRKRFKQYIEEGSVEACPISQIIIVGENGVGKTTLLYRLQRRGQAEIDQIRSTRGVECHTKKSGFIVTDGQLKRNKEEKSNLAVPPASVLAGGNSAWSSLEKQLPKEEYKRKQSNDEIHQLDIEDDWNNSREGAANRMTKEDIISDEMKNLTEGAKTSEGVPGMYGLLFEFDNMTEQAATLIW
ncbi:uncharacterized protein LOC125649440 [Ostrea edulis]|uniref:uncharacterized protein LOC125649440 n=1 Tax=Ostrea edulis TaxID=37623 RepID=UPI0024AEC401|nr:uncharacterized protein LOC125649440 [Ostrea edulis]